MFAFKLSVYKVNVKTNLKLHLFPCAYLVSHNATKKGSNLYNCVKISTINRVLMHQFLFYQKVVSRQPQQTNLLHKKNNAMKLQS